MNVEQEGTKLVKGYAHEVEHDHGLVVVIGEGHSLSMRRQTQATATVHT